MIAREMASIIARSMKDGPGFNDMGISESALLHIGMHLPDNPYILEYGGGQSSFVWNEFRKTTGQSLHLHVYNHDLEYIGPLLPLALEENINIHHSKLKQVSDRDYENVFQSPLPPHVQWAKMGEVLHPSQNRNYSLRNVFYENLPQRKDFPNGVDLFILDGPFGNGRSLAFPLLTEFLRKGTLVLIDDYTHYFFEDEMRRVFDIEILYKDNWSTQQWFLCRII